jgi:hypothetical protein
MLSHISTKFQPKNYIFRKKKRKKEKTYTRENNKSAWLRFISDTVAAPGAVVSLWQLLYFAQHRQAFSHP